MLEPWRTRDNCALVFGNGVLQFDSEFNGGNLPAQGMQTSVADTDTFSRAPHGVRAYQ